MIAHLSLTVSTLHGHIRRKEICWAGNRRLKIYGRLQCRSGKKIDPRHRVFFASEQEAIASGYRPCGHCLQKQYKTWKNEFIQPAHG